MNAPEIGGYFGLEAFSGNEYYKDLIALNTGRNALLYVLKARNIRKLYVPYYLCDCISLLCQKYGYAFEYYHIGPDFLPMLDSVLPEDSWVYVVNFFGQISNEKALELKARYKNIIFDNVQAFFQRPAEGIDTIYSCRKFFGVPDGGYLATDAPRLQDLPLDVSKDRMKHILGRFEDCGSAYYRDFQESDESYYDLELRKMSALTQNILRAVDYEAVCQKRNANYAELARSLDRCNKLELRAPNGPYCYPFYCENGVEVRKLLAQKKIYIPTLWPNVLELDAPLEQALVQNILPLPCDQRYDTGDMQRILRELANAGCTIE